MYVRFICHLKMKSNIVVMNGIIVAMIISSFVYIGISMSINFFRVNSLHNQGVTDKLVNDVSEAGEYLDKESIACKLAI